MNTTTTGNIPGSNLKRIKGQYVAAVAGVALAVSAVVAFGSISSPAKPVVPNSGTAIQAAARDNTVPQQYFYIVSSEAERGVLLHEGATNVVVAGSDAANALLGEGALELSALGIPLTIIDTTAGTSAVPSPRRVSQVDIAASVLSTELANFGATQPVQRQASDADIMNSVISTERAAFGE